MSKKTRKKSLATRSPGKAAAKPTKLPVRAHSKTSKRVLKKSAATASKSAAKRPTRSAAKASAAAAGRAKPTPKATKASGTQKAAGAAAAGAVAEKTAKTTATTKATTKTVSKAPAKGAVEVATKPAGRAAATEAASAKPVTAVSKPPEAAGTAGLAPGRAAPDFDLPRDGGGRLSLKDFAGRKLVLFFYPRASTPGCTKEAMDFTRLKADFESCGTDVVGVSADPIRAQDSFRDKYMLKVPLASDENQDMLKAYGAWGEKSMYGKSFLGIIRTTVLIDAKGRIARVWRHVKVDGHADEVLAAATSL